MGSGVSVDETGLGQPNEAPPPVVVFDFDGTLVCRDSFFDFAVRYCTGRPGRLLVVSAILPLALLVALRSLRAAGSVLLWGMTVGASTRSFVGALRRYGRHTLPQFANEAVFAELTRHVQAGSRVVIATGTVPVLVRELLAARGFGQLPIVGSRLRRKWGGLVAETHCTGRTKVHELCRKFGVVEWSTVYTDSFADRSLLRGATDITLVDPSSRTLVRTRQLISQTTALRVLRSG
jgi:phosphatidylglycerophosphatase C